MTKIEEIAASNQQHKEKSLKEQEMKLSNDRNTTELRRTHESIGDQEVFLANLGQLDICEIKKIAETCTRLLQQDEHFHFASANMQGVLLLACGWRDVQNWKKPKTLAMQLKSSSAEDEEGSAYAILRNRVLPAKHYRGKCLLQSLKTCEQS